MKAPSSFTKPEGTNVCAPAVVQHDCCPAGTIEELYTPPSGCELTETYVGTAYDKVAVVADNIEEVIKVATMIGTDVSSLIDSILIQLGHNIVGSFELGATVTKPTDYVTYKSEPYHYTGSVYPYEVFKLSEPNGDFQKGYRGSVSDWDSFDELLLAYAGLEQTGTPDTPAYSYRLDALRKLGLSRAWVTGGTVDSTGELLRYGNVDYVAISVPATMGLTPVGDANFQRFTVTMDDVVPGVVDVVKQYRDECQSFSASAGTSAVSASTSAQQAMDEAARAEQYSIKTEELHTEVTNMHQTVTDSAAQVASDKVIIDGLKSDVLVAAANVTDKHNDVVTKSNSVDIKHAEVVTIGNQVTNTAVNVISQVGVATDAANRASASATAASDSADRASVSASNANLAAVAADASKVSSESNANLTVTKATEAANSATQAGVSATTASTSSANAAQSASDAAASANTAINAVNQIGSAVADSQAAANQAALSATAAAESERNVGIYKATAESAKLAAETSVTQAQGFANSASTSATTATTKAGEASASAVIATDAKDAAKVSETNAATSKIGAEQARDVSVTKAAEAKVSANKAQDALDSITTLSIYRGTWDPEVTQAYPDNQGTSSQWDVSIASGTVVTFDNQDWKSGYRLVYSKPDNTYSRIVMESGVSSVDGKTGAVDLSSVYAAKSVETTKADKATTYSKTEVDANKVSKQGDTMTGSLNINNSFLRITNGDNVYNHVFENANNVATYRVDNAGGWRLWMEATGQVAIQASQNGNVNIQSGKLFEQSQRVYSPNNQPPIASVTGLQAALDGKYSPNNKPSPADIGALALTGGFITGATTIKSQLSVTTPTDVINHKLESSNTHAVYRCDNLNGWKLYMGSTNKFVLQADNQGNVSIPSGELSEKGQRVYSPNNPPKIGGVTGLQADLDSKYSPTNKPTTTDIGALALTGGTLTGTLWSNTSYALARVGTSDNQSFYMDANRTIIGGAGSGTEGILLRPLGTKQGNVQAQINASGHILELGQRVYSPNNKPSSDDVNALSKTASAIDWDTHTVGYNANANNGPLGTALVMGMTFPHPNNIGYNMQLSSRNGRIFFRNKENGVQKDWNEIYHTGNKPTAKDLGVVPTDSQVLNTSTDWDTLDTTAFYDVFKDTNTVFTNAPEGASYGTLQVIGRGQKTRSFVTQIFTQRTSNIQWFRTRTDGEFGWTLWAKIYSDAFKPTAADIGALGVTAKAVDSDKLDGLDSSQFLRSDVDNTLYGKVTTSGVSRQAGIYGSYDSNKIAHIWSIGTNYVIDNAGADFGNLYGFAYKHSNNTTGGVMANGHQAVWCQNGVPQVSLGTNIWAKGKIYEQGALLEDRYLGKSAKADNAAKLNGVVNSSGATASTIAQRNSDGDLLSRTIRTSLDNNSGAISSTAAFAYRTNNSSDNFLRFTNDKNEIKKYLGIPLEDYVKDLIGSEQQFPPMPLNITPGERWVAKDGSLLSRTQFPVLWEWVQNHGLVVTEAEWQAIKADSHGGSVAIYSDGTDSSNFRVPDVGEFGMVQRPMGRTRPTDIDTQKGHADQNKEHTHSASAGQSGLHKHTVNGDAPVGRAGKDGQFDYGRSQTTSTLDADYFHMNSAGQHTHDITVNNSGGTEVTMKYMWCSMWIYAA